MVSRKRKLFAQVAHGTDLTEPTLIAMNALRLTVMRLKPTTDPEQDFREFSRFCRKCKHIALFSDEAGKLVGQFVIRIYEGIHAGRRFRIFHADFGFVLPEYRGHPLYTTTQLRLLLGVLLRWRGEILLVGGIGYPSGLLPVAQIKPLYLSCDSDVSPLIRAALDRLIEEGAGSRWDTARGRKDMPTIPPFMPPVWHERIQREPFYQRYIKHCPEWPLGFALAGVAPIRVLPGILSFARTIVARCRRRA